MNPKWQWMTFGLMIISVLVFSIGPVAFTSEQSSLKADAGPDQSVSGNPATVAFSGSANVENYTCNWYNQWNLRRATNNCAPTFEVSFGKNPKAGTTRTFKLEVTDLDTGTRATDRMTVTLSKSAVAPPQTPTPTPTPPQQHHFSGQVYVDGQLAPPGGTLIADLAGSTVGETVIGDNGQYEIDVGPRAGDNTIEWLYGAAGEQCCLVSPIISTFSAGREDSLDLEFFSPSDDPADGHTLTE
jgi:hypothetical protein